MKKKFRIAAWCCVVAMVMNVTVVSAQGLFRNELKDKYDFKIVSCYTCHARVPAGTENPKQFRNDFGKLFDAHLKGKNVTPRLAEVDELDRDDENRLKVEAEVAKDFQEALKKIEATDYPDGGTYADALKKGLIEGIKLKD